MSVGKLATMKDSKHACAHEGTNAVARDNSVDLCSGTECGFAIVLCENA